VVSDAVGFAKVGSATKDTAAHRIHGSLARAVGVSSALVGVAATTAGLFGWHPLGLSRLGAGGGANLSLSPDYIATSPAESFHWATVSPISMLLLGLLGLVTLALLAAVFTTRHDTASTSLVVPLGYGLLYAAYTSDVAYEANKTMHQFVNAYPSFRQGASQGIAAGLTPYGQALVSYGIEPGVLQAAGAILTAFGCVVALTGTLFLYSNQRGPRF
jgi:hypothetical protein